MYILFNCKKKILSSQIIIINVNIESHITSYYIFIRAYFSFLGKYDV